MEDRCVSTAPLSQVSPANEAALSLSITVSSQTCFLTTSWSWSLKKRSSGVTTDASGNGTGRESGLAAVRAGKDKCVQIVFSATQRGAAGGKRRVRATEKSLFFAIGGQKPATPPALTGSLAPRAPILALKDKAAPSAGAAW